MNIFNSNTKIDIDCAEFEELSNSGYTIIDVRTQNEYNQSRIDNCLNFNFYSTEFRKNISELDKKGKYLVYCRSGNRSRIAVKYMRNEGFEYAYNLIGGITAWCNSKRKINE